MRAIVTTAATGMLGIAAFASVASANSAPKINYDDCTVGTRSVNCSTSAEADEWFSTYCIGKNGDGHCPGVGFQCATQDDGILCLQSEGISPDGDVSGGAGGTGEPLNLAEVAAGIGLLSVGGGMLWISRRRSRQHS